MKHRTVILLILATAITTALAVTIAAGANRPPYHPPPVPAPPPVQPPPPVTPPPPTCDHSVAAGKDGEPGNDDCAKPPFHYDPPKTTPPPPPVVTPPPPTPPPPHIVAVCPRGTKLIGRKGEIVLCERTTKIIITRTKIHTVFKRFCPLPPKPLAG